MSAEKNCGNCHYANENCLSTRGRCSDYDKWALVEPTIPTSTEHYESLYPNTDDIPEGTCEKCGRNRAGGSCGFHQKKKEVVVVLATRFYTLPPEEGMRETEPIVFEMEG